jgi:arylsulfatase A-like enzyme
MMRILAVCFICFMTGALFPLSAWGADRLPNVLLIMTDDQGYGDFACHGNPILKTPNLDRLHAASVRLTNFHVDPTCSPTRSALMTGRYSSRTGVWHTVMGRSLLCRDEVTMADVFTASGYKTGIFGKWHLGGNYPYRPGERGFGEVLTFGGGGAIGNTPDVWGNNYFDDTLRHNARLEKMSGYCTDVFFAAATRFIEENKDRPFFCYLPTNAPHAPYNVAERYSKPYWDRGVPEQRANFYGMIANIDENVGRLLDRLRELKLEENTLVVFLTDNGTAAGTDAKGGGFNAGMRGFKGSEYEGGHRVPCFFRWPTSNRTNLLRRRPTSWLR